MPETLLRVRTHFEYLIILQNLHNDDNHNCNDSIGNTRKNNYDDSPRQNPVKTIFHSYISSKSLQSQLLYVDGSLAFLQDGWILDVGLMVDGTISRIRIIIAGEMRQVDVGGHPVLLCRDQGDLKVNILIKNQSLI